MNRTHPLIYFCVAFAMLMSAMEGNMTAALAWLCAIIVIFTRDLEMKKLAKQMYASNLFIEAHGNKWPSEKAVAEASEKLAAFEAKH